METGLVEAIVLLFPLDELFAAFRGYGYSRKGTKKAKSNKAKQREGKDLRHGRSLNSHHSSTYKLFSLSKDKKISSNENITNITLKYTTDYVMDDKPIDIIFCLTNKELCTGFEKLMKDKFQMSSMGELTFFLGLQVQQKEDGIFISQDKYVAKILKKFNYSDVKSASTPVDLEKPLVKDGDVMDSPFELVAYTDSDYAGATLDRKSTTGGCQFLGNRLISWQCKKQTVVATSTTEAEYVAAASCCGQVGDEAVHKELGDRSEKGLLPLPVSALEAEQDSVNPMIYTSCIEQFWATAKVQTVNGVRQIQTLVDKKMVIVMESSIRRYLHLDDAEDFSLLSGSISFILLLNASAKSIAWNELNSSMASLIICLATNQKFNLSKYIFDAMVKHLDGGVKFLLYPCFLQVFINQQLGNMSTHKKIFVNPFHTKKVFANMKRARKDFSVRIIPLFDTMMVQPVEEMEEDPEVRKEGKYQDYRFEKDSVLDDVEMPMEAKVDGKDEQSTKKLDDSTTGEAVTTIGNDSVVPTTNEEITLAFCLLRPLIQIKQLSLKRLTPRSIISDRDTHFCNDQFAKVMLKYRVTHHLSTAYHPQKSGQVDDALSAFRTAFKIPIGCTPYKLMYGKACHLPIELKHKAYWAFKHCNFDLKTAGDHRKVQMNELNELPDQAYENSLIYKERTKKVHDSKIKNRVFNVGTRYQIKDKIKAKARQNRAREWKEREKTSSTAPPDLNGPARYPLNGPGQPM
ncbi:putative ribonuclease H-like domain-containing protein [Tanacetum coccineum]